MEHPDGCVKAHRAFIISGSSFFAQHSCGMRKPAAPLAGARYPFGIARGFVPNPFEANKQLHCTQPNKSLDAIALSIVLK